MERKKTEFLVKGAIIASIYTVLTLAFGAISYGNIGIEFRIAEALTVLPIFSVMPCYGLFAGCILSNLIGMAFSGLGIVDVIVGSLATLIASVLTYILRNIRINGFPFLSFLPPIIVNAVVVGFELKLFLPEVFPSLGLAFVIIGAGEAAVVFALGIPLYLIINNNPSFKRFLSN